MLPNLLQSQLYWSNNDSLCCLYSVLAVLVNNKCLQLCLDKPQAKQSILGVLYSKFNEAQDLQGLGKKRSKLNEARRIVFEFLQTKMQCQLGVNDCSLTALNLLLNENAFICGKFMQEYCWRFTCDFCGYVQINR